LQFAARFKIVRRLAKNRRRARPNVFQAAFRILGSAEDAEDVAQDVFLEVFKRGGADKIENWGACLRRLTVFRALDRRRKRRGYVAIGHDEFPAIASSPVDEAVQRELAERLRDMIAGLPEREGAVFALRYLEGLSNPQIAEVLEISAGAVAVALHRVRSKLEAAAKETTE
jgi:RNA polymerase sigma factor (sigma-70 family)